LDNYFGDWVVAFLALHINRPLLGQRAVDVAAGIEFLTERYPEQPIEVIAYREATTPTLVACLLEKRISRIELVEGLLSWDSAFEVRFTKGVLSNVVPGILKIADIPDLVTALHPCQVTLRTTRRADGETASPEEMNKVYRDALEKDRKLGKQWLEIQW
jgi:hypothetical protein